MSDISGNNIKAHRNESEEIIKIIRDWFKINIENIPKYKEIWFAYNEFTLDYVISLESEKYNPNDINALIFKDIIESMIAWVVEYKVKNK